MSPVRQIEARAADWLVRRNAGLPPTEEARFQEWLGADPRHAAAIEKLAAAWDAVSFPCTVGRADVALAELRSRELRRTRRRKEFFVSATALAAAVLLLATASWKFSSTSPPTESSIVTARPDHQVLADGSTVDLNARGKIVVEFSAEKRTVRLLAGEAFFAITKDPKRPFVVSAGGIEVRAVGTEFVVRYEPQQVDVVVTEGRVALKRVSDGANLLGARAEPTSEANERSGGLETPLLTAGHRALIPLSLRTGNQATPATSLTSISGAEVSAVLAWRNRRMEFTRTPLAEAIKVFNRQNRTQISIADPAVERLPISGILWTDDPDGFVRLLERGFDVHATRAGESILLRLRDR